MFTQFIQKQVINIMATGASNSQVQAASADGSIIFVGIEGETVSGMTGAGAVHVYESNDQWATYVEHPLVTASVPAMDDGFGDWISCTDSGDTLQVLSRDSGMTNRSFNFQRSGNTWVETQVEAAVPSDIEMIDVTGSGSFVASVIPSIPLASLTPVDGMGNYPTSGTGFFTPPATIGAAVAINEDGTRVLLADSSYVRAGGTGALLLYDTSGYAPGPFVVPAPTEIFLNGFDMGGNILFTSYDLNTILTNVSVGMVPSFAVLHTTDGWATVENFQIYPFPPMGGPSGGAISNTTLVSAWSEGMVGRVEAYNTSDGWATASLDQTLINETGAQYGIYMAFSKDNTTLAFIDQVTGELFIYTRTEIPVGPVDPTEDTLEDLILLDTDRGLIGRPPQDNSVVNAATPNQQGQPQETDHYYTVLQVGQDQSMGRVVRDKTWTNVRFGFMP
jgi:hypothetical protein